MGRLNSPPPLTRVEVDILGGLERINAAIAGVETSEELLTHVLDEVLDVFDCDRAWLLYPCSLETKSFKIPMERSRPDFPGAGATSEDVPVSNSTSMLFKAVLESESPVAFDARGDNAEMFARVSEEMGRFQIKSQLLFCVRPKGDQPWLFGIHHCREAMDYAQSTGLFRAIGRRIADGLTSLVATDLLRQSENRFRALAEHAPHGIIILDGETLHFTEVNHRAEKLFGRSRAELIGGLGPLELSPDLQSNGHTSVQDGAALIAEALAGGFPVFEWDHLHVSGRVVSCEVRLARLPHATRSLLHGSVTDITDRRQADQERAELQSRLAQSQKMEAIGNLTGGIAHDFNNFLMVILGSLDLLELDAERPEMVRHTVAHMRVAADRARALTHGLLAFARRQPLRPRTLHLGRVLEEIDGLLRSSLGETIEIEIIVDEELWLCAADEAQIQSAVLNLAINARDAMPEGGDLTIEVSNASLGQEYASSHEEVRPGEYVMLCVTDEGVGMSAETLEKAFTPFFTTKGVGEGTGLGLSMVYGFVKQSGGHVKADSKPGFGTTLRLYLPRAPQGDTADHGAISRPQAHRGRGELLLVVEDEPSVRAVTRELLERLGYRIVESEDAAGALQQLSDNPEIDMLITDVVLKGGMNGAQLAKIAVQERSDLPVLFVSGYTADAIISDGTADSNVTLLAKPFTQHALSVSVRDVLQGRKPVA